MRFYLKFKSEKFGIYYIKNILQKLLQFIGTNDMPVFLLFYSEKIFMFLFEEGAWRSPAILIALISWPAPVQSH